MWVVNDIKYGIGLEDNELKEMCDMVKSGKYKVKEITEWYGLTYHKFKAYLKMARKKGFI